MCDHESPEPVSGPTPTFAFPVNADKTREVGKAGCAAGAAVAVEAATIDAARRASAVAVLSTPAVPTEPGLAAFSLREATAGVVAGSKNSPLRTALGPAVRVIVISRLPETFQSR
jgi:hypothetical protein